MHAGALGSKAVKTVRCVMPGDPCWAIAPAEQVAKAIATSKLRQAVCHRLSFPLAADCIANISIFLQLFSATNSIAARLHAFVRYLARSRLDLP